MAKYLNPKNDLTFKRIFGEHPELLIDFLNSVMPFESNRQIVEIEYLPSELAPDTPTKKYSIVDVRCKDNFKRKFIIEMQMFWNSDFYNRIVFNAGKAYVRQLEVGEEYHLLQPVYTLALLNENFDKKTDNFYHHYQIVNKENTNEVIPGLEFVLVELTDKFRHENITDRKLMVLWLRFLKEVNENMRELPPEMRENKFISKAAEICESGAFSPEELAAYDKYWDIIRTEKALKEGSRREGRAEGEVIGEKRGLQKGRAEGKIEGKIEGEKLKTIEIAKKMKERGTTFDQISEITGLTIEEIEKL